MGSSRKILREQTMIELPWKDKQTIDRNVLRVYVDTMVRRSEMSNMFAILMPVAVYEHIKNMGINAELVELPETAGPDMIWLTVNKVRQSFHDDKV